MIVIVAVASLALGELTLAHADLRSAVAKIQVIQCPAGKNETPQLFIAPASQYPKLQYEAVKADIHNPSAGYYEFNLQTRSGNYFLKAQSSECGNYLQAGLISGHTRILSLPLVVRARSAPFEGNLKLFDQENAVAGTLPIRPQAAYLVAVKSGGRRVLDLQDGGFYIERVPPGRYMLRMEFHGGFQSDVPIDLTSISPIALVERDVSIIEVRQHLGNILATGATLEKCEWCYR